MSDEPTPLSDSPAVDLAANDSETMPLEAESGGVQTENQPAQSQQPWLLRLFSRTGGANAAQRLDDLEHTISAYPDDPTGYVLRAELYYDLGEYELAQADFENAQKLAAAQLAVDNWGVISQTMQDRALVGLTRVRRRIGKREQHTSS